MLYIIVYRINCIFRPIESLYTMCKYFVDVKPSKTKPICKKKK